MENYLLITALAGTCEKSEGNGKQECVEKSINRLENCNVLNKNSVPEKTDN
jgi:hypothetical protein